MQTTRRFGVYYEKRIESLAARFMTFESEFVADQHLTSKIVDTECIGRWASEWVMKGRLPLDALGLGIDTCVRRSK